MKYEIGEKDGVVILGPKGKILDDSKLDELEAEMNKLVRIGARRMVVDFGEVPWMCSRGFSILRRIQDRLKEVDGGLRLARTTKKMESLIAQHWFDRDFKLSKSVDLAVKTLKS